jgi:hypothetical protein
MIDRYKKLIADVRSIDAAQVPYDTNLIIKEAVLEFTALWAQLEYYSKHHFGESFRYYLLLACGW